MSFLRPSFLLQRVRRAFSTKKTNLSALDANNPESKKQPLSGQEANGNGSAKTTPRPDYQSAAQTAVPAGGKGMYGSVMPKDEYSNLGNEYYDEEDDEDEHQRPLNRHRASLEQIVMQSSNASLKKQVSCSRKSIQRILRLVFLRAASYRSKEEDRAEWIHYILYWLCALGCLGIYSYTYYYMSVSSGDFLDIISNFSTETITLEEAQQQFYETIWKVVLATLASSFLYTLMLSYSSRLANVWRERITHYLFQLYFHPYVFYEINHHSGGQTTTIETKNNAKAPMSMNDNNANGKEVSDEARKNIESALKAQEDGDKTLQTPLSSAADGAVVDIVIEQEKGNEATFQPKERKHVDNVDIRLSNDIRFFAINMSNYLFGTLYYNGVLPTFSLALAFTILLVQKGGAMGVGISYGSFVFFAVLNSYVGSWVAQSNYRSESANAYYQFSHHHMRAHAEHVAFYNGQDEEREKLSSLLQHAIRRTSAFITRTFALNFVTNLYYWLATVLCYALPGAIFFSLNSNPTPEGANDLYSMTVISSYLQLTFSYAILLSEAQSALLSYGSRVGELLEELEVIHSDQVATGNKGRRWGNKVAFTNVTCYTPNGTTLVKDLTLSIESRKENLIIMGVSGAGKSSILRILCGLWPVHSGEIEKPYDWQGGIYFVPQKPYLTLGSLREQFSYPRLKKIESPTNDVRKKYEKKRSLEHSASFAGKLQSEPDLLGDEEIAKLLSMVNLSYLLGRFSPDSVADWSTVLSVGEQQRIGMARLFHHRPQFALLDESTSAVDVDMEKKFYETCIMLDIQFISVAHRPSCVQYHDLLLKLQQNGAYEIKTLPKRVTKDELISEHREYDKERSKEKGRKNRSAKKSKEKNLQDDERKEDEEESQVDEKKQSLDD